MKALSIAYNTLDDGEVDLQQEHEQQSVDTRRGSLLSHRGVHYILASSLAWAFGNSLNSISVLVLLHPVLLLVGFCETMAFAPRAAIIITLASGAIANLVAYSTLFGYPRNSISSCALSAAAGVGIFGLYILFALLPHYYLTKAFGCGSGSSTINAALPLVLPICVTAIHHIIIGDIFSTFASPANALLDIEPLKNVVYLFGSAGLCFVAHLLCSCVAMMAQGQLKTSIGKAYLLGGMGLLVFCSFIRLDEVLYQRNATTLLTPAVPVSCIFALNVRPSDASYEEVWASTKARVDAGDKIVMWSEEAVHVYNDEEESALIKRAQDLLVAKSSSTSTSSFIGLAYIRALAPEDTSPGFKAQNIFTLITGPYGQVAWRYAKAFPVPFIESDIQPGPPILPIYHHHSNCSVERDPLCGKTFAGGICFDLDFADYIAQAGRAKADILLQPSWTWNAINERHFLGDAVRAAENGLNIFRCSSDGTSGVVGSKGQILSKTVTGHDPSTPILFQLQLQPHHSTLFTRISPFFPKTCIGILFLLILLLVLSPDSVLSRISIKRNTST